MGILESKRVFVSSTINILGFVSFFTCYPCLLYKLTQQGEAGLLETQCSHQHLVNKKYSLGASQIMILNLKFHNLQQGYLCYNRLSQCNRLTSSMETCSLRMEMAGPKEKHWLLKLEGLLPLINKLENLTILCFKPYFNIDPSRR